MRRRREVALLLAHRVAEPRLAGVPVALGRVDRVVRAVRAELVRDLVEDEELALRAHEGRVGDARRAQVLLGALGDPARILGVRLARDRIGDLADQRERRRLGERDRGSRTTRPASAACRTRRSPASRGSTSRRSRGRRRRPTRREPLIGSVTCCQVPSRSQNFRSTICARGLTRPLERLAGVRRARLSIREVVLRLVRPTCRSFRLGTTKKEPRTL